MDLPSLVAVSAAVDGFADVLTVDFGGNELLLGDGNASDDDDSEWDGVNGGLNIADVGQGKAGESGEVLELHFGIEDCVKAGNLNVKELVKRIIDRIRS